MKPESKDVEKTFNQPDIHQKWTDSYRNEENENFYNQAFDYITGVLNAGENAGFLDAGCGSGAHSVHLANRGFSVLAVDFSKSALEAAEQNLRNSGLTDRITLQQENILSLSFDDGTFDYILCWGVLMHMPDIERAISELDRVLKKNGTLVISEGNMFSLQSMILNSLKLITKKAAMKKTPAGLEFWKQTPSGNLLTRQADTGWLKKRFRSRGFIVRKHVPGQFTELYAKFSSPLIKKFIHYFNHLWFKYVRIPHLAFGNIIILEKRV
ncbi:MAG: class I SAM-dependent methyltransferase [Desulfobacterales bacterium]|nr:class I SAM-dependent methyltransferase [Desulfobacterales bacterium]